MDILELILIGFSLAMDAFSVALCKGLTIKTREYKKSLIIALYFGIFQSIMPLIGYFLGKNFQNIIVNIDHYIVFFLLLIIGTNMIIESKESCDIDNKINFKIMLPLALATSVDALAVGIGFAFLKVNIYISIAIIGIITFILSYLAVNIGCVFGNKLEKKSQIAGGIILILLGIKILLEHLNVINF